MSLEVKGTLIKKLEPVSGEGRNGRWEKQEFVIETDDQYPKKICMDVWGDKISMLSAVAEGDRLTVSINLESREYNSKWYTNVRAWRIVKDADEGEAPPPPPDGPPPDIIEAEDDLPF
ncbi:MAG: DUF3127 domain-containing protein [Bacteroidales bacterium]|nr:DUF3127 domain-containing protein [Bacteroidales bacterium]